MGAAGSLLLQSWVLIVGQELEDMSGMSGRYPNTLEFAVQAGWPQK